MDYPPDRMDCQYCDEKTNVKLPFCDHHAHPVCVWVAHQFRFKNETLECPTCHAKQTAEIRIWKHDALDPAGVTYAEENQRTSEDLPNGDLVKLGVNGGGAVAPRAVVERGRHRRGPRRPVVAPPPEAVNPPPAVQVVNIPVANPREQARARFNAHRQAGRIPATAVFGGIHHRNCGHRGCQRVGGEMGVRFVNGLYRCEVHRG